MAPFYGWGSTALRLQPLQGGSLPFTTKSPEIPGTHFIDLGKMKGWVDFGATRWLNNVIASSIFKFGISFLLLLFIGSYLKIKINIPAMFETEIEMIEKLNNIITVFAAITRYFLTKEIKTAAKWTLDWLELGCIVNM